MHEIIDGVHLTRFFPSWGEFLDHVSQTFPHSARHDSLEGGYGHQWDFGVDFDGAMRLASDGWPEGESKIKRLSVQLFDKIFSMIEREFPVYDVEGSEIDIARYLDGEPECWIRMETRNTEGPGRKNLRLVFNLSASGIVEAQVIEAKGAVIAALIELLEYAGHGVEVVTVLSISERRRFGGQRYQGEVYVKIKDVDQPLDVSRLAFALMHPTMLRRLHFRAIENFPVEFQTFCRSGMYGTPEESTDKGDIYISKSRFPDIQWSNSERAKAWIIDQLKLQGVALSEEERG